MRKSLPLSTELLRTEYLRSNLITSVYSLCEGLFCAQGHVHHFLSNRFTLIFILSAIKNRVCALGKEMGERVTKDKYTLHANI